MKSDLKYTARIIESDDYYIFRNYNLKELLKLDKELEEAAKVIVQYREHIAKQYNKATQAVEQIKIIAKREKNEYSRDKKVKIVIQARKVKVLNNQEVSNDFIYSDNKSFSYQEKTEALLYVYELINKYPGSKYYNETTYKFMEV